MNGVDSTLDSFPDPILSQQVGKDEDPAAAADPIEMGAPSIPTSL